VTIVPNEEKALLRELLCPGMFSINSHLLLFKCIVYAVLAIPLWVHFTLALLFVYIYIHIFVYIHTKVYTCVHTTNIYTLLDVLDVLLKMVFGMHGFATHDFGLDVGYQ
jgi:hypothetical protein